MIKYQIFLFYNSRIIDKKKKENVDLKSCIFFPCKIALGFHLRLYQSARRHRKRINE